MTDHNSTQSKNVLHDSLTVTFSLMEQELMELGVGEVAYIKPYLLNGKKLYVLHSADGAAIDVQDNESKAVKNAYFQDLYVVSLH